MKHTNTYSLSIGWLYPQLMSTYGDRGNVTVLQKRCEWRGIDARIHEIGPGEDEDTLKSMDLIFMGGAQDRQQEIVSRDLQKSTGKILGQMIESEIPALLVCGGYQFFGNYYKAANGKKIPGLGFFNAHSESPVRGEKRLIGHIIAKPLLPDLPDDAIIVGFENHGGRTHLQNSTNAFATVIKGNGNNGDDKTEGAVYKNAIGSYMHGPMLSKSPELADYLISKSLFVKYKKDISLSPLDDTYARNARNALVKREQSFI